MKTASAPAFLFLIALFLLLGCTGTQQASSPAQGGNAPAENQPPAAPQQQSQQPSAPSQPSGGSNYIPEADCMGITAEKLQAACSSGPLLRTMVPIYLGYECTYHALDTEGFGGLGEIEGKPTMGVQAKLSYFSGESMAHVRAGVTETENPDSIMDIPPGGFYTTREVRLLSGMKAQSAGVFLQKGQAIQILRASPVDYGSFGLSEDSECSLSELLSLAGYPQGTVPLPPEPQAPTSTGTEGEDCPCKIFIADQAGAVETKEGRQMNPGDELQLGDRLYAIDADITIAVVCGDKPDDIKIFVIKGGGEPMEVSIGEGEDGKPAVSQDPGVATVSVVQRAQYETDFQVSTPRLTCSVRG